MQQLSTRSFSRHSTSQQSTRSSAHSTGDSFASFESDDLLQQLELLIASNEQLAHENELYLSFLMRVDPKLSERDFAEEPKKAKKGGAKKRTKPVTLVSVEQKVSIAQKEVGFATVALEKVEQSGRRLMEDLRAIQEETDTRIYELKHAAFEFKRDVLESGRDDKTGKLMAERVLRYMDDVLKQKTVLKDKLMLKNTVLRDQIRRHKASLKEKEQLGEGLGQVDFDQLKIENKQNFDKIQERNSELIRLKKIAGNTLQLLNIFKTKLAELVAKGEWLKKEIASKKEFLAKTAEEGQKVGVHRDKLLVSQQRLSDKIARTKVPAIIDYVNQKSEEFEIAKKIADYERKMEITKMELRALRTSTKSAQSSEFY